MTTEILGADELAPSQGSPDVTHNNALRQIEGRLVRALDKDLTVAPSTPTAGDVYIVASGATGTWSAKDKKIAHFWGGSWKYYTPIEGNSLWINDEDKRYVFDGSNWVIESAGALADGDYGDFTISSGVATIDNDAITYAKMQNVSATDKLLGRSSSGAGDVEEITCTSFARSLLEDATASDARSTLGAEPETTTTVGALVDGATSKSTPVDADYLGLMDSVASNILKKLSWANVKATLKAYFDTLYAPLTQPFCAAFFYPGMPSASALVMEFAAPSGITTITFAAAISGSSGKALTAATAQTDFDVRKNATTSINGTSVGTIRFAASGTVPTFIAASDFSLTGGTDYLTIWAPATPDVTLADIAVTLYGTR